MKQFYMQLSVWWGYLQSRGFAKPKGLFLVLAFLCSMLNAQAQQTFTFDYTGSIVEWTVPAGVNHISIEAKGAQGGDNIALSGAGGKGAYMKGNFIVTPGQVLRIVVGQMGQKATSGNQYNGAGGGGGGSFVWVDNEAQPLIVAGGGGGSSLQNNGAPHYLGKDAVITNNGTGSRSHDVSNDSPGGINGNDGTTLTASGGKGWNSVKLDPSGTLAGNYGGHGGFGGGGGAGRISPNSCNYLHIAGGGGGYSGGGAGGQCYYFGGGGGGSYNSGTEQVNSVGANPGNGKVVITNLYSASITETKSISCAGDATGELTATVSGGTAPYTYSWSPSGGTGAVASNLTAGTYTVTVTDALGAVTTATKEIKVNDTVAPKITGTKVINVPAGQSANWNMYTYNFTDPLPAGAVVTGVTLAYSGNDQGWGGTGAWARMIVSETHIGSSQFFGNSQNFTIEYKGALPQYVYGGNNYMRMDFDTWPGWVAYFHGGTMTIHYEIATLPDVTGQCSATAVAPTATDNCAGTIIGTTTDPLTYNTQGTHVITWKFDDGNGNITTATQNVIIADKTNPTITAPATVTVNTDAGKNTASGVALGNPVTADNCELGTITNNAPATFPVGNTTVTWTATDKVGNTATATQIVTVEDKEAPVPTIATLPDVTGECAATATAPTATDNVSGNVTGTTTDALTYSAQGTYTITWTYADAAGNKATQQQKVIVKDITKPTVVTKNITVNLDASGNATIAAADVNNGSSDNCAIAANGYSLDKTSFTCANVGNNTVTLMVTDAAGNTESKTAIVTVKDVTAPLAKAKNITVQLDANGAATIAPTMVDNGSSDLCGAVTLVLSKTTFDCTNLGTNTVTLTVTDAVGNESTTTATVTVEDKVAPLAKAKNITVQLDATGNATIVAADVNDGSTDNCGIKTIGLSKSTFDCSNVGENTVTLTVTDISDNVHDATAIVTVEDRVAPVVITQNITVQLDATGNATITADEINNGSTDACGIRSVSLSKTAFDCANIGANTVTLTVTDNNGNVATKTAIVTVEDKIAPIAITKNITVKLDATGKATIVAADVNNGSSDVCGDVTLGIDKTNFDCSDIGEKTVILTVTDRSGNSAAANATVTIVDDLAPVVATRNITVQLNAEGKAIITPAMIDNGSADNCSIGNMKLNQTEFACGGTTTVTLTVEDVNGNVASGTAIVTVEDKVAPVANTKNITVELDETGKATIVASDVENGSTDNCEIVSYELSKTAFDCSNVGDNTVNLIVTDKAGNTAMAAATVTIVDHIKPTITAPGDIVLDVDAGKTTASNVNLGTPFTADNCSVADVYNDVPAGFLFPTGTTIVIWTVLDKYGNKTTATQTVTVRRDIVTVTPSATINVPIRTAYASLQLPANVAVTYSDGSTATHGVNWAQGNYNGLVAGNYSLTGTLVLTDGITNTTGLKAAITVVVEPNKVPTALAFSATTFAPNAQPNDVIGTLTTTDPDDTEFTYALVAGTGDTDNNLFQIIGDKVYLTSNNGLSGQISYTIRVRSTDPYQNTIEKSFTLTKSAYATPVDKLKIVNAFSPNGDGINDTWTIPELRFYNNVEVEVFDRSGVRLFHTTNPEMAWDGRSTNGQILKGAFFYIVQVKDINLVKKGVVTILKK
ncbi:HYR domain-containing protein [Pontibacter fetidus]|uniref:receptor protein-tyrosine kinase n=1 Tax=Pontibacter fetidus TaxID=2700082 RepID=A0A6B2H5W8_9BACT|nr:HYR domain-containing protein [Pontibacter fetidus]NDK55707.1 HYR domain-containing protein [Pontibacter fetidus]